MLGARLHSYTNRLPLRQWHGGSFFLPSDSCVCDKMKKTMSSCSGQQFYCVWSRTEYAELVQGELIINEGRESDSQLFGSLLCLLLWPVLLIRKSRRSPALVTLSVDKLHALWSLSFDMPWSILLCLLTSGCNRSELSGGPEEEKGLSS